MKVGFKKDRETNEKNQTNTENKILMSQRKRWKEIFNRTHPGRRESGLKDREGSKLSVTKIKIKNKVQTEDLKSKEHNEETKSINQEPRKISC